MLYEYGCETWSLTLRLKFRLRALDNRILRRILRSKSDENGEWKRLYKEELHSLYLSPNIVRAIKSKIWADDVARMEEGIGAFKMLTDQLKGFII